MTKLCWVHADDFFWFRLCFHIRQQWHFLRLSLLHTGSQDLDRNTFRFIVRSHTVERTLNFGQLAFELAAPPVRAGSSAAQGRTRSRLLRRTLLASVVSSRTNDRKPKLARWASEQRAKSHAANQNPRRLRKIGGVEDDLHVRRQLCARGNGEAVECFDSILVALGIFGGLRP